MFRLQNHVPEVYVDKSRDFQLFCRLYDVCFSGVKFSTDSLTRSTSTQHCDSSLLELLKTKLGLFSSVEMDSTELRYVLQAFPTIMRYKGSMKSIKYITILYTKMYPSVSLPEITFGDDFTITLNFTELPKNYKLLNELVSYVLPAGYGVHYTVGERKEYRTYMSTHDTLILKETSKENLLSVSDIDAVDTTLTVQDIDTELGAVVGLTSIVNNPEENET